MQFVVQQFGGRDDGADVLGGPVGLDNYHVRFSILYGEASPDPEHSKDPSALEVGEYTTGVAARDRSETYKVVRVS